MDERRGEASFSSFFFLVFAVALAAAVQLVLNQRYEQDLSRQVERRQELELAIDREAAEARRLEVLEDSLERDSQTIEGVLRKNGWGRPGDIKIEVVPAADPGTSGRRR